MNGLPLGLLIALTLLGVVIAMLIAAVLLLARTRRALRRLLAENSRLLQAGEQRRALNARQRSEFLANMSHELRTPLNAIMGFAQILQRDKSLTERQTRALEIIDESGRHLHALIADLLDLARIDAAELELHPVEINLGVFLQTIWDTIRTKAEDKGLLPFFQATSDLPGTVSVDEERLRQVLLNLLSNAVKFTDSGSVTLRVESRPPSIEGTVRLRFEVADEGLGMNDDQMLRLFQPFEQVSETRGAGPGLALSRQLVRLMGGDIAVRSRVGEGSVFAFEIDAPMSQGHTQSVSSGAPVGCRDERRKFYGGTQ